ncbi:glutamate 5-kinase [Micrococcales bacterium 31B]|nr:glutamate 5-kinase [Micrococcales bacterium 31B]
MIATRSGFTHAQCVVIKVGSSSLTTPEGEIDEARIDAIADAIATRRQAGTDVVLVSSGAIAAGLGPLGLDKRPRELALQQAAASVGQGLLLARYAAAFAERGVGVGQVLLTAEDVIRRGQYRNAQRTLTRLLELGFVPIVNENDTVATDEIRFGDNDRLAALVSHLVSADALVLLTDVDGLYDRPPSHEGARRIDTVPNVANLAGVEIGSVGSKVGTGGMVTKLQAADLATSSGTAVILAAASSMAAVLERAEGGTFFPAVRPRGTARRLWLRHAAQTEGSIIVDDGAARALQRRSSLLAVGVREVRGTFEAGDPVEVKNLHGTVIARGLSAYDAPEVAAQIDQPGQRDDGTPRRPIIHADDLVVVARG